MNRTQTIEDRILKSALVDWRKIEFLQPDDFKELDRKAYMKLKNSIVNNEVVDTFNVWEETIPETSGYGSKLWGLDGLHRCRMLEILDGEGFKVKKKYRANFIDCRDKKDAFAMVFLFSSVYAKTQQDGLFQMIQAAGLSVVEILEIADIPYVDINKVGGEIAEDRAAEVEFTKELLLEHNYIVLYFDNPMDWKVALDKFGLKNVKDLIPRKMQPTGVGRVIEGKKWLDRIK